MKHHLTFFLDTYSPPQIRWMFIILFLSPICSLAQSLSTDVLQVANWRGGTRIICYNAQHEFTLPAKFFKHSGSRKRVKLAEINEESFTLHRKSNRLAVTTRHGKLLATTVPKTNVLRVERKELNLYYQNRNVPYYKRIDVQDKDGKLILRGEIEQEKIVLKPMVEVAGDLPLIMLICFEELLQLAEALEAGKRIPISHFFY
ncbi:MAG: hypothetical protein AAF587_40575 [Bacteroidota bacterium]